MVNLSNYRIYRQVKQILGKSALPMRGKVFRILEKTDTRGKYPIGLIRNHDLLRLR